MVDGLDSFRAAPAVSSRRGGFDLDVVYCLSNQTMPGWFKIGFTTRTAAARANDLYAGYGDDYTTGVPVPFEVVRQWELPSGRGQPVEQAVHRVLGYRRPNPKREFFRFDDSAHAVAEIERALQELDWYATAVAEVEHKQREAQLRVARRREAEAAERVSEQRARETVTRIEREMRMEAESSTAADCRRHGLKWAGGFAVGMFGLGVAMDARDTFILAVLFVAVVAYYWNRTTPLTRLVGSAAYRGQVDQAIALELGSDAVRPTERWASRPEIPPAQQMDSAHTSSMSPDAKPAQANASSGSSRPAVLARCPSCGCLHQVGAAEGSHVRIYCERCTTVFEATPKASREDPDVVAKRAYLIAEKAISPKATERHPSARSVAYPTPSRTPFCSDGGQQSTVMADTVPG